MKSQRLTELCWSFGGLTELCRHFQFVVFLCNAALVHLCQTPGVHAKFWRSWKAHVASVGLDARTQEVWEKLNQNELSCVESHHRHWIFIIHYSSSSALDLSYFQTPTESSHCLFPSAAPCDTRPVVLEHLGGPYCPLLSMGRRYTQLIVFVPFCFPVVLDVL